MLTRFNDAYMRHQRVVSLVIGNCVHRKENCCYWYIWILCPLKNTHIMAFLCIPRPFGAFWRHVWRRQRSGHRWYISSDVFHAVCIRWRVRLSMNWPCMFYSFWGNVKDIFAFTAISRHGDSISNTASVGSAIIWSLIDAFIGFHQHTIHDSFSLKFYL